MMSIRILLSYFVLSWILFCPVLNAHQLECPLNLSYEDWEGLTPYFLPDDHPIKKTLDKLFSSKDVLKNETTLNAAGFKLKTGRGHSKAYVLQHKKLKKFLVKAYTDEQVMFADWQTWLRRIEGALTIDSAIIRLGFEHWFKVPKKWLYQVPRNQENVEEKNFVLVVEDMQLFDQRGNAIIWNGTEFVTKEKLNALYTIVQEEGLLDSLYIDNIPFSTDMKIAFVDTEHVHKWPVVSRRFAPYLAGKLQPYWLYLIEKEYDFK